MSKEVCSQCGFDHESIRVMCLSSPFAVARILCNFPDLTERFHKKVIDRVTTNINHGNRRMAVFIPRGHLKTSMLTIALTVWLILRDRNVRILLMQGSTNKAAENLDVIRLTLESDRLRHWFPEIVQDQPWNNREIKVKRTKVAPDPTVSARSPESKTTGGHFDVHIVDDLVGEDNFMSDAEMERALRWLKNSPPLFVNPAEGIRIVVGTRWPNDRVYQYIFEKGSHDIFQCGIYVDERCVEYGFNDINLPVWPERFNEESISILRKDIDDFEWSHQYLNIPVSDELRRFKQSDLLYWDWIDPKNGLLKYRDYGTDRDIMVRTKEMFKVMSVDLAASGDATADESAIEITGKPTAPRIFVLEDWGGRVTPEVLANTIIEKYLKWQPNRIEVEKGALKIMLEPYLRQEMMRRGIAIPIYGVEKGSALLRNKTLRIDSMQPFFNNKQVFLPRNCDELARQLLHYQPTGFQETGLRHDDRIDALSMQTKYWRSAFDEPEDPDYIEEYEDENEIERAYGLEIA